jgi:serine protease
VRVVPIRVFDDSGQGGADALIVAEAIRWAAGLPVNGVNPNPYPAQIINVSLGADAVSWTLNEAVQQARDAGAIVVAAAGNASRTTGITTPANAPGAVAVGSVDHNYQRSSFSNFDAGGRRTVDLMAPGGLGPSSCRTVLSAVPGNTYGCKLGTSMAAPFVAGVAALVWSQNPSWTADEVIARLKETAYFDDSWDPNEYGAGVVCADAALGAATTCGRELRR